MLTAFSSSEQSTLDDANRLMHVWDLASSDCHRLRYLPEQGIEIHGEEQETYLEDLLALSVHYEDLTKVVNKALDNFKKSPRSLQNHYAIGQQYQGLRALLHKMASAIDPKAEILIERTLDSLFLLSSRSAVQAAIELRKAMRSLNELQLLAAANHKLFLYETKYILGVVTNEWGAVQTTFVTPYMTSKELTVATVQIEDTTYELKGRLEANFAYPLPRHPTFTNTTRFRLIQEDGAVPIEMSVYPKWAKDVNGYLMTLPQFQQCPQGAHDYVRSFTEQDSSGVLSYQPPSLAVVLTGPFANPENSDVLPIYFQAMVEIAKNHHCYQVELFIPFDFITHAYALGFYSTEKKEQALCKEAVELQLAHKRPISLLPEELNQFEGNEELLLPVYFPLDELNTRPVYFTEQGLTTTYGELSRQLSLFKKAPSNSILPDPYGLLARPFCSIYQAINKRRIDGKPIPTTVSSYQKELTDSHWIKNEHDLVAVGEATHIQPDKINKTVRILR